MWVSFSLSLFGDGVSHACVRFRVYHVSTPQGPGCTQHPSGSGSVTGQECLGAQTRSAPSSQSPDQTSTEASLGLGAQTRPAQSGAFGAQIRPAHRALLTEQRMLLPIDMFGFELGQYLTLHDFEPRIRVKFELHIEFCKLELSQARN